MDDLDIQWRDFDAYYCKHGYYRGLECPDCDTSSPVEVLSNRDPGDEDENH